MHGKNGLAWYGECPKITFVNFFVTSTKTYYFGNISTAEIDLWFGVGGPGGGRGVGGGPPTHNKKKNGN